MIVESVVTEQDGFVGAVAVVLVVVVAVDEVCAENVAELDLT